MEKDRPFLLTIAFPCGPWSPWQRLRQDQEALGRERALWHPVLMWVKKIVRKQRSLGGYSLLENPWPSVAWQIVGDLQEDPKLHDEDADFYIHRIDLCQYGLRDQESLVAHWKPTGIGTDSREIGAVLNRTCPGDHVHQVLEGSNCYGRRTRQAAKWTAFLQGYTQGPTQRVQDPIQQLCLQCGGNPGRSGQ